MAIEVLPVRSDGDTLERVFKDYNLVTEGSQIVT